MCMKFLYKPNIKIQLFFYTFTVILVVEECLFIHETLFDILSNDVKNAIKKIY